MAYSVDPTLLDTSPLPTHPLKAHSKSKMLPVHKVPVHPLQQNTLLNFWEHVLIPCARCDGPFPLPLPMAESVVFRDNQAVGWYRWDAHQQHAICRPNFPHRVPIRSMVTTDDDDDAAPVEELDWDAEEDCGPMLSDDEEPPDPEEELLGLDDDDFDDAADMSNGDTELLDHSSPQNQQMANIRKRFMLPPASNEPNSVVALFIGDALDGAGQEGGSGQYTLDYMDCAQLRHFLASNKHSGVLQRYIPPEGGRHTIIQAIWTPYLMIVERRQNRNPIQRLETSIYERTATGVAASWLAQEIPVSSACTDQIKSYFMRLAQWIHCYDTMQLNRAVAYFTVDDTHQLHLLWMSAFELMPANTSHPFYSHKLQAQVMKVRLLTKNSTAMTIMAHQEAEKPPREKQHKETQEQAPTVSFGEKTTDSVPSRSCACCSTQMRTQYTAANADQTSDSLPRICNRNHSGGHPLQPASDTHHPAYSPPKYVSPPRRYISPYDHTKPLNHRQLKEKEKEADARRLKAIDQRLARALKRQMATEKVPSSSRCSARDPNASDKGADSSDADHPPATTTATQRKGHHLPALAKSYPSADAVVRQVAAARASRVHKRQDKFRKLKLLRDKEQAWNTSVQPEIGLTVSKSSEEEYASYRNELAIPQVTVHFVDPQPRSCSMASQTEYATSRMDDISNSSFLFSMEEPMQLLHTPTEEDKKQEAAVLTIQRHFRGHCVRSTHPSPQELYQKRRWHAAITILMWWRRVSKKHKQMASPKSTKRLPDGCHSPPVGPQFGKLFSEKQRRRLGHRHFRSTMEVLFPDEKRSPRKGHHQHDVSQDPLPRGTSPSTWRRPVDHHGHATFGMKGAPVELSGPSHASYVAIEAKYNNRMALDFIEDMFYEAYSHSLNRKRIPFRFALPPELGNLRAEIDAMLVGFGVQRDLRTAEEIEAEGKVTRVPSSSDPKRAKPIALPLASSVVVQSSEEDLFIEEEEDTEEEDEDLDGYFQSEGNASSTKAMSMKAMSFRARQEAEAQRQKAEQGKALQYRYQLNANKGALLQLNAELEAFREFATKAFAEDPSVVQRIKDGVESGQMTYYDVIMQVKREKEVNRRRWSVPATTSGIHMPETTTAEEDDLH